MSQNSTIEECSSIESLPVEVLLNVFSFLPPDVITDVIPRVSVYWRTLSLCPELGRGTLSYLSPKLYKKIQLLIKRGIDKDPFEGCPYVIRSRPLLRATGGQEYYAALIILKALQILEYNPNTVRPYDVSMLTGRLFNGHPRAIFTHESLREKDENEAESYFQLALAGANTLAEPHRGFLRTEIMKEKEAFRLITVPRERSLTEGEKQKLSAALESSQDDTVTFVYNTANPIDEIRIAADRLVKLAQLYDWVESPEQEKRYKQERIASLAKEEIPQVYKRTKLSQEDKRYLSYLLYAITEGVFKDFSDVFYPGIGFEEAQRYVVKNITKYIQSYQSRQKMENRSKQWTKTPEKQITIVISTPNGKRSVAPAVLDKPLPENNIIVDAVGYFRGEFNPIPNKNEREFPFAYACAYPFAKNVRKDRGFYDHIPLYVERDWTFVTNPSSD